MEITYRTIGGRTVTVAAKLVGFKGYAMPPGTGPIGETCKTCKHHTVLRYAKNYHKCGLTDWTHGAATDIRVRSPACVKWEKK